MAERSRRRSRRDRQREEVSKEAEVDMTSMIDVVFLLIVFFLCIDFKVLEAKLPAYLPKDKGSDDWVCPEAQLRIRIVCDEFGTRRLRPGAATAYRLVDHRVHYMIDAERFATFEAFCRKLRIIHADHDRSRVADPKRPGERKVMSVVVAPGSGAVYADVSQVVDAVIGAGFPDVNFGGGMGRRNRRP